MVDFTFCVKRLIFVSYAYTYKQVGCPSFYRISKKSIFSAYEKPYLTNLVRFFLFIRIERRVLASLELVIPEASFEKTQYLLNKSAVCMLTDSQVQQTFRNVLFFRNESNLYYPPAVFNIITCHIHETFYYTICDTTLLEGDLSCLLSQLHLS